MLCVYDARNGKATYGSIENGKCSRTKKVLFPKVIHKSKKIRMSGQAGFVRFFVILEKSAFSVLDNM